MLNKTDDFRDEFKFNLLIIRTIDGAIFGVFVDEVICPTYGAHKGSSDSFVFSLAPVAKQYVPTGDNEQYMLCEMEYLSFGGGNEGPAITIKEDMN